MMNISKEDINILIEKYKEDIIALAIEIARIPSFTGKEEQKAEFIAKKLKQNCEDIIVDEIGNVLCKHKVDDSAGFSLICAHMDTVFDISSIPEPRITENRVYLPSIHDNSINAAALIFIVDMLNKKKISTKGNILFAFNVGEEGLGNLKGIKHIVNKYKNNIEQVIALDLGYEAVIVKAVGSRRYNITVKTQGGHSWIDFGNHNAILEASKVINDIYQIRLDDIPKTTYNIGTITGGNSINSIAQHCVFSLDIRSEDKHALFELENKILELIKQGADKSIQIKPELIAERPCGELSSNTELMRKITEIRFDMGLELKFLSGSTDANIPLSLNIPAVCFGVGIGGGAHTMEEYIEIDSIFMGMKHLISFIEGI